MSLTTYTGLITSIAAYLDNDDLTAFIDDFIALAEARHKTEIRIREMYVRTTTSVVTRYVELPLDYLNGLTFRLLTDPLTRMEQLSIEELNRRRRTDDDTGQPLYFALHTNIEVDRVPDKAYSAEIIYYKSMEGLSSTNADNELLLRSPGVYLYGALVEAEPFLMNDERISTWEGKYTQAKDALNLLDGRGLGQTRAKVNGPTP